MHVPRLGSIAAFSALCLGCSAESLGHATAPQVQIREVGGVAFITQNLVHPVNMDALFQGGLVADAPGCLRLANPGAATVIWPQGFTATLDNGSLVVRDRGGAVVGRVGEAFRFGGGEVQALSDAMGFTLQDRRVAEARCPGAYWIVAE